MARKFGKDQRVYVTQLTAREHDLTTLVPGHCRQRRQGAVGVVVGGVGDTYVVRHDLDHSEAAYTGSELAVMPGQPMAVHDEPEARSGDMTFATA